MYRKSMRLFESTDQSSSNKIGIRFIDRVAKFPPVLITWKLAAGTYNYLKTSNSVLNKALVTLEDVVLLASSKAQPFVKKFEPQLKMVEDLACQGIERIEDVVPMVTKPPEKVVKYAQDKYNEMIRSGLKKYDEVKLVALSTVQDISYAGWQRSGEFFNTPSGELILTAFNSMLDAYETYLDFVLPPLGEEYTDHAFGDRSRPPVMERADKLTEKFKERLYKHTLLCLQNIKLRGKIALGLL